jgi:NAD(P)-dependent dehydrogenase (short-subunit alcohol dehydrogenase family)
MATYLVTGTNRGIGYEYCRQLQARGDRVIAVCRSASEELKQLGVRVEERLILPLMLRLQIYAVAWVILRSMV